MYVLIQKAKKRSRLHEDDSVVIVCNDNAKKRSRLHEDDSVVIVPSMKRLLGSSLKEIPIDMVDRANNIIEKFQSSWVESVQRITQTEVMNCNRQLEELFGLGSKQAEESELDRFYEEHVLSKINLTEKDKSDIVLNIGSFLIPDYMFVEVFQPGGQMSNWVAQGLANVWNEKWSGVHVMLDVFPVCYFLKTDNNTGLIRNLQRKIVLNKTKQIFIPILSGDHWLLVVFNLEKNYKTILDSMTALGHRYKAKKVVSEVDEYLKSLGLAEFNYKNLSVNQQNNYYDCGYYMMLFILKLSEGKDICTINQKEVTINRKRMAMSVFTYKEELTKLDLDDATYKFFEESNRKGNKKSDDGPVEPDDDEPVDHETQREGTNTQQEKMKSVASVDSGAITYQRMRRKMKSMEGSPRSSSASGKNAEAAGDVQENTKTGGTETASGENAEAAGISLKDAGKEEQASQKGGKNKGKKKGQNSKPELVSPVTIPSACGRAQGPDLSEMLSMGRMWLKDEILEKVYQLVNSKSCKDQVILASREISMTGSQLEQSLQGGEDARNLMIFFMKCLDDESVNGLKRIFVSPLDKDDQDLEKKIQDAVPSRPGRNSRPCALSDTIIYCPVFFSGEWIVVCFVLRKVLNQIHVFCHKDSFRKVTDFCRSLGEKLNKAFERCGYKVVDFGAKLASTSSAIELNGSAFASMFFIEKFKGSQDSNFQKFTWKEDEYRDEFIKVYKLGLLPYLMNHKKNAATVPDAIAELISKSRKNQRKAEHSEANDKPIKKPKNN